MKQLNEQAIEDIAMGAAVLGTGGGGDPFIGKMMALEAVKKYGPVSVVTVDELEDQAQVVPVCMIGAPTVMAEKIPSMEQVTAAIECLEQEKGQAVDAVMPIEIGGVNSLIPIVAAAKKGIPVLDADAMGRAFPESQMVTFHLEGYLPGSVTLADEKGNVTLLRPIDGVWSERLARAITVEMGGSASMCDYWLSGADVKRAVIPGTLHTVEKIGRIIREAHGKLENPVRNILRELQGYELFTGKVVHIERSIDGGFTRGKAAIEGTDRDRSKVMNLYFQNEHLLAKEDGKLRAVTPDLIAVLDEETGYPVTTENIRYGARVTVVAFPAHPKWRTEVGLETAGPRYFGYDCDYIPVEKLCKGGKAE
jgi:DUF917 family protein